MPGLSRMNGPRWTETLTPSDRLDRPAVRKEDLWLDPTMDSSEDNTAESITCWVILYSSFLFSGYRCVGQQVNSSKERISSGNFQKEKTAVRKRENLCLANKKETEESPGSIRILLKS